MCGITGIFSYSGTGGAIDADELIRMREAMLHRGPDGAGFWISQETHVGLAHRRLAIVDLSEMASQPMLDDTGSLVLIYNGEIYNYRELRTELESAGSKLRTASDTEILLHLYRKYDLDMVHHLRGMFAFALWDNARQRLLLARDHLGIKPLYFSNNGHNLRFASQVKALIAGKGFAVNQDPAAIVGFHLWGHIPEPFTPYRQIQSLEPGTLMTIQVGKNPEITRYFNLSYAYSLKNSQKLLPVLGEALEDSVKHHLMGDVPVSVFQSAGIDSSVISTLASRSLTKPISTVTLGFSEYQGTPLDEVPLAESMASALQLNHVTQWLRREDFEESLADILEKMDMPTIDGLNTYFIAKVAAEAGYKVALSGIGGDEFFQGYPSFQQIPVLLKFLHWVPASRKLGKTLRVLTRPIFDKLKMSKYAGLIEYGDTPGKAFLLRRGLFMPWELPDILDRELLETGLDGLQTLPELENTTNGLLNLPLQISALETRWYLQSRLLRDADWAGMAHSLEIRTPFIDHQLLPVFTSLLSREPLPTKVILAKSASIPLYEKIVNRPKSGFNVPIRDWLQSSIFPEDGENGLRGWSRLIAKNWNWESKQAR